MHSKSDLVKEDLLLPVEDNVRIINKYLSTRTTIDNSEIYYIEAIKNKKFHIYKVNKVEEAMEILTDEKFNIIKELSIKKLRKYSEYKK